jgi:uncharacterized protein (UPF0333 family)
MKKFNKNNKGFSHLEMILLLVVIAAIASVGLFVYSKNNNKSKADSIASTASMPVTCKITGVTSSPGYGTVQSPVVTIYNKSGRNFNGQVLVELHLTGNGDGSFYNVKSGIINKQITKKH